MTDRVGFYNSTYGHFQFGARELVRRETYGEDLGQNSWLTADEWRTFAAWLGLEAGSRVLDVACGSGGPALYLAQAFGAHITGADHNSEAVTTATRLAEAAGLSNRATFVTADAGQPLPFDDAQFDAITCIDAINHLPGRAAVLRDWHRLLKPGGRLVFTDPIIVTGLLTNEEMTIRSSIGYFLFAPMGEDERLLLEAGFEMLRGDDTTAQLAEVAKRWHDSREKHRTALLEDEGEDTFAGTQRLLTVAYTISSERRLSRYAFLAQKPSASE